MNTLKAFVKYDSNGRAVPGVLLLRKKRPVGAGWVEIPLTLMALKRGTMKSISLDLPSDLETGDTETATIAINYLNGGDATVSEGFTLSTSDDAIISVTGETVTAVAEGTAIITATFQGMKSSVEIEVTNP